MRVYRCVFHHIGRLVEPQQHPFNRQQRQQHEHRHERRQHEPTLHATRDAVEITGAERLRHDRIDGAQQPHTEHAGIEEIEIAKRDRRDRRTTELADHERVDDAHGLDAEIDEHDRHGDARHVQQIGAPGPAGLDREDQRPLARFAEDTRSRTSRSRRGAS